MSASIKDMESLRRSEVSLLAAATSRMVARIWEDPEGREKLQKRLADKGILYDGPRRAGQIN